MFWEILICALAAGVLILLGWGFAMWALLPVRGEDLHLTVTACGDAERLEQQCRSYLLLQDAGVLELPLLICDTGLSPAGRKTAELLVREHPQVRLCQPAQWKEMLQMENRECEGN